MTFYFGYHGVELLFSSLVIHSPGGWSLPSLSLILRWLYFLFSHNTFLLLLPTNQRWLRRASVSSYWLSYTRGWRSVARRCCVAIKSTCATTPCHSQGLMGRCSWRRTRLLGRWLALMLMVRQDQEVVGEKNKLNQMFLSVSHDKQRSCSTTCDHYGINILEHRTWRLHYICETKKHVASHVTLMSCVHH